MQPPKLKIGIFGGSGMTASELIRWVIDHPRLEFGFIHSRHHAGKPISEVHTFLQGMSDIRFVGDSPEKLARTVDVVFLALAHGEATEMVKVLSETDVRIIDLTGDHRLSTDFVYGLTELAAKDLKGAKKIANPGCFATAAILAAAPAVAKHLAESTLFFSSVTGSSGAGITPVATTHHPFRNDNLFAYKIFSHQHEPEVAASLSRLGGDPLNVVLTTHSGPFVRGIHSTLHFRSKDNLSSDRWSALYRDFYANSPFVRVREKPPSLKDVVGSNFADLHVVSRGNDVIVISVLDNLVKGAVGEALQNLNVVMGWDEKEGLWKPPVTP